MADLNRGTLIEELARRCGIRLDSNDPAITIVIVNQLVLENAIEEFMDSIDSRLVKFEASVQKVEHQAENC